MMRNFNEANTIEAYIHNLLCGGITQYTTSGFQLARFRKKIQKGVGLPRKMSKRYPDGPYWEDVKEMTEGTVTQVVEDDTLPGGPFEKTIEYHAPWVRCSRERDYGLVWEYFEGRFGRRFP
jgi:hypothetical protein